MADPIRTDDFPTYDSYPGPESRRTPRPGRDFLPSTYSQAEDAEGAGREDRMSQAAGQIGSTVGRAVHAVRELPERLQRAKSSVKDRLTAIRGAGGPGAGLKKAAQEKFDDARAQTSRLVRDARMRARRVAHERPLYIIAGAAMTAFLAGAALRLWRNHE